MSPAIRILIGLGAGLAVGAALGVTKAPVTPNAIAVAGFVGGLWLDALKMTVVPLVFALLVTGISAAANASAAGGIAARSLGLFVLLLCAGAALSATVMPLLLTIFPILPAAAEALRAGAAASTTAIPPPPPLSEWLHGIIPVNAIAAASTGAMLPVVVFALFFGFAATRVIPEQRERVVEFFRALAAIMLVIVRWVLWIAPVGVFGLALAMGAQNGLTAVGALGHYILLISAMCILTGLTAYPLAVMLGRLSFRRFARAAVPAQSVAASTQSSLASLPAMVSSAETQLGLPSTVAGVTLPLAVSLYRATSPIANFAVAIYVASVYGIVLAPASLLAGAAVAVAANFAAVGISSQVSFFVTISPICLAMGVPVELLAVLIAVETIPDIFRTTANVTMDLAVATIVTRQAKHPESIHYDGEPRSVR
jgi:Na+/H+-dicarboxylate symporter